MWTPIFPIAFLLMSTFPVIMEASSWTRINTNVRTKTYKIKSPTGEREVDVSDDNIGGRAPRTPKQLERDRILRPLRIIPNSTPCSYKTFLEFFHDAANSNSSTIDVLTRTTIQFPGDDSEYYFYDAEELCIEVDDELVIDFYKYDCSKADVCVCGIYMGYVDLNVVQPPEMDGERRYMAVNGLDRKLVEEDGMCVSGHKGHCTTDSSTALVKLECHSMYDCIRDDTFGPILQNLNTKELYGICLPRAHNVSEAENKIVYEKLLNRAPISQKVYDSLDLPLTGFVLLARILLNHLII